MVAPWYCSGYCTVSHWSTPGTALCHKLVYTGSPPDPTLGTHRSPPDPTLGTHRVRHWYHRVHTGSDTGYHRVHHSDTKFSKTSLIYQIFIKIQQNSVIYQIFIKIQQNSDTVNTETDTVNTAVPWLHRCCQKFTLFFKIKIFL